MIIDITADTYNIDSIEKSEVVLWDKIRQFFSINSLQESERTTNWAFLFRSRSLRRNLITAEYREFVVRVGYLSWFKFSRSGEGNARDKTIIWPFLDFYLRLYWKTWQFIKTFAFIISSFPLNYRLPSDTYQRVQMLPWSNEQLSVHAQTSRNTNFVCFEWDALYLTKT